MSSDMTLQDRILRGYRAARDLPVAVEDSLPDGATAVIYVLAPGEAPAGGVVTVEQLAALGFAGGPGDLLALPGSPVMLLAGVGEGASDATRFVSDADAHAAAVRDAVGLASRRAGDLVTIAVVLNGTPSAGDVQAAVEGAVLARYSFDALRETPKGRPLASLTIVSPGAALADAEMGRASAAATVLARDLANTPHSHMNATTFAEIAVVLAGESGIEAEVWDGDRIRQEGLGGVLAINAGSAEPPRVVRLTYIPQGEPSGHLALVGKGIMYDSGGIGLKDNNDSHAQMKSDMTGAANILGAMLALPAAGGSAEVTGYLMCTDNMPSATATALGDVTVMRGGRTVEIVDTDAEGRMVMADGIVLATEEEPDAIVDIATLTGHMSRALGPKIAGTVGSDQRVVEALRAAGSAAGEPLWQMPLAEVYRSHLESPVADQRNVAPLGIPDGIIASLFLQSFAGDVPWGHVDIAGVAWNGGTSGWQSEGCSAFGARLLLGFAKGFSLA